MTVQEKRASLTLRCINRATCDGCRLANDDNFHCDFSSMTDDEISRAYDVIYSSQSEIKTSDPVNSPSHYSDGKIEPIEFIEDKNLGFCLGNAVKYIARAGKKDPTKEVEDLKKARWYIDRRIYEIESAKNAVN